MFLKTQINKTFLFASIILPLFLLLADRAGASGLQEWIEMEWSEFEDKSEWLCDLEVKPLNVNNAAVYEIASLPGITYRQALWMFRESRTGESLTGLDSMIIKNSHLRQPLEENADMITFADIQPFSLRMQLRANRRFGKETDEYLRKRDGSAVGMTQRLHLTSGKFQAGILLDKDQFEPSYADLSRFWGTWTNRSSEVIIGDYFVTHGFGLGIWTRPALFQTYDSPVTYKKIEKGIQPAFSSTENSALRGAAFGKRMGDLKVNVFLSDTWLDAVFDDSRSVPIKLSDSGLHRTAGESGNNDAVRERLIGGTVNYLLRKHDDHEFSVFAGGYSAHFNPPLQPEESARQRFLLSGKRAGALSTGFRMIWAGHFIYGEAVADLDKHAAWMAGWSGSINRDETVRGDLNIIHSPIHFHNPRNAYFSSGNNPGMHLFALLLRGRHDNCILSNWKSHIEIEQRLWRSYTVPTAILKSKASLELRFPFRRRYSLTARYRRSGNEDGQGEENPVIPYTEDRLRLTNEFVLSGFGMEKLKVWGEYLVSRQQGSGSGNGHMLGASVGGSMASWVDNINYAITLTGFNTPAGSSLYLGESFLPDRFSSVRLSGAGFRWSAGMAWRNGKYRWAALEAARTIKSQEGENSPDLEIYLTFSYYITVQTSD